MPMSPQVSAANRSKAEASAPASPAGTHTPQPTSSISRHTSLPGSTHATTGLPAAMMEYTFDGIDVPAMPRRSSTTPTSADAY
ncbi:MAG TPA: hypothetical protein VFG86_03440, partial [Chloroflexota bacterium]|nr:hypothetical protein [Chloroflexota bacterium]